MSAAEQERELRRSIDAARRRSRQHWEEVQPAVERKFGGIPHWIAVTLPTDPGITLQPSHFHAIVFDHLVAGKAGSTFELADAAKLFIPKHAATSREAGEAVKGYLRYLKQRGFVSFEESEHLWPSIKVVTDVPRSASQGA